MNPKFKEFRLQEAVQELFSDKFQFVYLWNKIFRKRYLKNLRFDEKINNFGEDLIFCYKYLKQCPENSCAIHVKSKLYHYIRRKGSISSITKVKDFPKHKLNFLKTLDQMALTEKNLGRKELSERINSWHFLVILQFLYETKKIQSLHRDLKNKAKLLYKDYKKHINCYKNFRKFGFIYKFL